MRKNAPTPCCAAVNLAPRRCRECRCPMDNSTASTVPRPNRLIVCRALLGISINNSHLALIPSSRPGVTNPCRIWNRRFWMEDLKRRGYMRSGPLCLSWREYFPTPALARTYS